MRKILLWAPPLLCLAAWLGHAALLRWMAGADVVQVLLSGGGATAPLLAGAAAFVGLRVVVRLVLPGLLLAWLGALAWDRLTPRPASG